MLIITISLATYVEYILVSNRAELLHVGKANLSNQGPSFGSAIAGTAAANASYRGKVSHKRTVLS